MADCSFRRKYRHARGGFSVSNLLTVNEEACEATNEEFSKRTLTRDFHESDHKSSFQGDKMPYTGLKPEIRVSSPMNNDEALQRSSPFNHSSSEDKSSHRFQFTASPTCINPGVTGTTGNKIYSTQMFQQVNHPESVMSKIDQTQAFQGKDNRVNVVAFSKARVIPVGKEIERQDPDHNMNDSNETSVHAEVQSEDATVAIARATAEAASLASVEATRKHRSTLNFGGEKSSLCREEDPFQIQIVTSCNVQQGSTHLMGSTRSMEITSRNEGRDICTLRSSPQRQSPSKDSLHRRGDVDNPFKSFSNNYSSSTNKEGGRVQASRQLTAYEIMKLGGTSLITDFAMIDVEDDGFSTSTSVNKKEVSPSRTNPNQPREFSVNSPKPSSNVISRSNINSQFCNSPRSQRKIKKAIKQRESFLSSEERSPSLNPSPKTKGETIDTQLRRINDSLSEELARQPTISVSHQVDGRNRRFCKSTTEETVRGVKNKNSTSARPASSYHHNCSLQGILNSPWDTQIKITSSLEREIDSLVNSLYSSPLSSPGPQATTTNIGNTTSTTNPRKTMAQSLGNLANRSSWHTTRNEESFERAMSQSILNQNVLQKRLEDKAGSEQELSVAKSLSRITLPSWYVTSDEPLIAPTISTQCGKNFGTIKRALSGDWFSDKQRSSLNLPTRSTLSLHQSSNVKTSDNTRNKILPFTRSRSEHKIVLRPIISRVRETLNQERQLHTDEKGSPRILGSVDVRNNSMEQMQVNRSRINPPNSVIKSQTFEQEDNGSPRCKPFVTQNIITRETNIRISRDTVKTVSSTIPGSLISSRDNSVTKPSGSNVTNFQDILTRQTFFVPELHLTDKERRRFGVQRSPITNYIRYSVLRSSSPDLQRDELLKSPQVSMTKYEIDPDVVMFGKNSSQQRTLICGNYFCRKETVLDVAINRVYHSCVNCYTYYCCQICREHDWLTQHASTCDLGRLKIACKNVLAKLDHSHKETLFRLASSGMSIEGRGCVMMCFPSHVHAQDFCLDKKDTFLCAPFYCSTKYLSDFDENVLSACVGYDPTHSFVLTSCITALTTKGGQHFVDTARIYKQWIVFPMPNQMSFSALRNSLKNSKLISGREIMEYLQKRDIRLQVLQPIAYRRLVEYIHLERAFKPIQFTFMDPSSKSWQLCEISMHHLPKITSVSKYEPPKVSNSRNHSCVSHV